MFGMFFGLVERSCRSDVMQNHAGDVIDPVLAFFRKLDVVVLFSPILCCFLDLLYSCPAYQKALFGEATPKTRWPVCLPRVLRRCRWSSVENQPGIMCI